MINASRAEIVRLRIGTHKSRKCNNVKLAGGTRVQCEPYAIFAILEIAPLHLFDAPFSAVPTIVA